MKKVALYCRDYPVWGKGVGEFVREMVGALMRRSGDDFYYYIVLPEGAEFSEQLNNAEIVPLPKAHRVIQDHVLAPRIINRLGVDLAWLPKNVLPYGLKTLTIVTFLDLAYFMPEYNAYPFADCVYMKRMFRRSAAKASLIVAISEQTRRDTIKILGAPPEKVVTIPLAAGSQFRRIDDPEAVARVRNKYSLPADFIFYAGSLTPRKNLMRLLEAYERIMADIPHDLVITGWMSWNHAVLKEVLDRIGNRIHLTGRIAREDLPVVYNAASVYAHPSLYEGFGLTVLEAQACGVPVLNSTASCMPEVGGDGALYVDPLDTVAMAQGLRKLCLDPEVRRDLIDKGQENAKRFSWEKSADLLHAQFRRLCEAQ